MIKGYIRVSTDKQSVDGQKLKILNYANEYDLKVDDFISLEISSKKSEQEREILTLKNSLKKGDTLIATELSRLGRDIAPVIALMDYFAKKEVKVVFTNQPELSINGAVGTLMFAVYGFMAQTEREFIAVRTKQGLENAKAKGKTLGRPKGATSSSKLDSKKDEIHNMLGKGVNITNMAKMLDVSRPTLVNYLKNIEDR
jgi:DNA invertase Pin-like site-specific DNA recombinase